MKKITALAILSVLCITLVACDTETSSDQSEEVTKKSDVQLTEEETTRSIEVETEPVGCQHAIVTEPEVPATCVTDGMTKSRYCSKCGESFEDAEVIPALGHLKATGSENCEYCQRNYWVCIAEENISIRLNVYHPNTSENSMCDIYVQNKSDYLMEIQGYFEAGGEMFSLYEDGQGRENVGAQSSGNVYFNCGFSSLIVKKCYLDNESIANGWFLLDGNRVHFKCDPKGNVVFAPSYQEVKNMVLGE